MIDFFYRKLDKKRRYRFNRGTQPVKLLALLRVRNEELILQDTLDHLQTFCDGVICYDDASTDRTFAILKNHPAVWGVVRNYHWKRTIQERLECETQDRLSIMEMATEFQPEWLMCVDADERFVGDIRGFLNSSAASAIDAVRIQLFDAYMTREDQAPYRKGDTLLNFRKFFGPEQRNILMLWRSSPDITYRGLDAREPTVLKENPQIITRFYCQHYGKSLSISHWEETCDYYLNFFPYETYGKKWEARKGKAIHVSSDFGTELHPWDEVETHGIIIHPS